MLASRLLHHVYKHLIILPLHDEAGSTNLRRTHDKRTS